MARARTQYEVEYKKQIVKQIDEGLSQKNAASKYGIPTSTLAKWVSRYSKKVKNDGKLSSNQNNGYCEDDFIQMQKRITELEEDNAILKKAMTVFVKK